MNARNGFFGSFAVAIGAACAVLSPAANADFCRLPWDVPCCQVCNTTTAIAMVNLKIQNCTDVAASYQWSLPAQNGLTFSPNNGIVFLQPGQMTNIPITVCCPPGLPVGVPVVYTVNVTNVTTGNVFSCPGSVIFTGQVKAQPCDPTVPTGPGRPTRGGFVFTAMNDTGAPFQLPVALQTMPGLPIQFLNVPSTVMVRPGSASVFEFLFQVPPGTVGEGAAAFADVLILWDQDGDGDMEVGSSIAIALDRGGPCPTDFNGDGITNSQDLAFLLGSWGGCP